MMDKEIRDRNSIVKIKQYRHDGYISSLCFELSSEFIYRDGIAHQPISALIVYHTNSKVRILQEVATWLQFHRFENLAQLPIVMDEIFEEYKSELKNKKENTIEEKKDTVEEVKISIDNTVSKKDIKDVN